MISSFYLDAEFPRPDFAAHQLLFLGRFYNTVLAFFGILGGSGDQLASREEGLGEWMGGLRGLLTWSF